jgi:predicted RNase H-like nuclease (RuvC/YqgF family)
MKDVTSWVGQEQGTMRPSKRTCGRSPSYLLALSSLLFCNVLALGAGCKPEEPPLAQENDRLRKQVAKLDSMIISLQEGNKVMQQQINLLNQEMREARQKADAEKAERNAVTAKLEGLVGENRKLAAHVARADAQRAQLAQALKLDDIGGESEELPQPLPAVSKAAEEALSKNGYAIRLSVRTDEGVVYVTDRKVSAPTSLEVPAFRNQYLISMHGLSSKGTRLIVKADFEKIAQGNRILTANPEEIAEIERRLITEIAKALNGSRI